VWWATMLAALGALLSVPIQNAPTTIASVPVKAGAHDDLSLMLRPDPWYNNTAKSPGVDLRRVFANGAHLTHPVVDQLASTRQKLDVFMWGDSTMLLQYRLLVNVLTGGRDYACVIDCGICCGTLVHDGTLVPVSMPVGGDRESVIWCSEVEVFTNTGVYRNATYTVTAATCTQNAASVAMVPALLKDLQQNHGYSAPSSDSLLYIGGAGLHHLHDDDLSKVATENACLCRRDWELMKPLEATFEDDVKYGLSKLQELYPEAKLAYFNTHSLCNQAPRAVACDSHDWKGCFSGVDVQPEERDSFCEALYSPHGSAVMAARERALLKESSLKWALVDGHRITKDASCDQTPDGTHYSMPVTMVEIEAAFTVFQRKRTP